MRTSLSLWIGATVASLSLSSVAAAEDSIVDAARKACGGVHSEHAAGDSIHYRNMELTIAASGHLEIYEEGVLLKKIESVTFSEYAQCVKDIITIVGKINATQNLGAPLDLKVIGAIKDGTNSFGLAVVYNRGFGQALSWTTSPFVTITFKRRDNKPSEHLTLHGIGLNYQLGRSQGNDFLEVLESKLALSTNEENALKENNAIALVDTSDLARHVNQRVSWFSGINDTKKQYSEVSFSIDYVIAVHMVDESGQPKDFHIRLTAKASGGYETTFLGSGGWENIDEGANFDTLTLFVSEDTILRYAEGKNDEVVEKSVNITLPLDAYLINELLVPENQLHNFEYEYVPQNYLLRLGGTLSGCQQAIDGLKFPTTYKDAVFPENSSTAVSNAVEQCQTPATTAPQFAQALSMRGSALEAAGKFDEAEIAYERAIAFGSLTAPLYAAGMHQRRGFPMDAQSQFDLSLQRGFAQALNEAGKSADELRDYHWFYLDPMKLRDGFERLRYYWLAAILGSSAGQFNLAYIFDHLVFVGQFGAVRMSKEDSSMEAAQWLAYAAINGSPGAKAALSTNRAEWRADTVKQADKVILGLLASANIPSIGLTLAQKLLALRRDQEHKTSMLQ